MNNYGMPERLCDACGSAVTHCRILADMGQVRLCEPHYRMGHSELMARVLARRAARSPRPAAPCDACKSALVIGATSIACGYCGFGMPDASQPKEVDPRTLPVGAVFHHVGSTDMHLRVTDAGESCVCVKTDVTFVITSTPAILISLPEAAQEVELGTLAVGEWFDWAESERKGMFQDAYDDMFIGPFRVDEHRLTVSKVYRDGNSFSFTKARRVLRVPAPSSAVDPTGAEVRERLTGTRVAPNSIDICGGLERLAKRQRFVPMPGVTHMASATQVCPGCDLCDTVKAANEARQAKVNRWPNTPQSEHARMERMLSEQVATGGQDCLPARSLIERADRLRRENADRELGYIQEVKSRHTKVSGIASLRLERPLIAWKRRK